MLQCWCATGNIAYDRHGVGICDIPCRGNSLITCGGTYAFEIYPFPATAAPTQAPISLAPTLVPVTLAPTPAPTLAADSVIAEVTVGLDDLVAAVQGDGDIDLLMKNESDEVVGNIIATVTPETRRQLMKAIDGQHDELHSSNRALQDTFGVSVL